jgi:predicted secreted protein
MAGIAGLGAELLLGDGASSPNFNLVANVTSIGGPALALDTEDVTAHDSTGGWEEVVPTILRTGEVTLDINYDPASQMHRMGTGAGLSILVASTADEKFTVLGDYHLLFTAGVHFRVEGSTGNDGSWEVDSSVYSAPNTVITVTGNITDATADGKIVVVTLPMALKTRELVDFILRFPDIASTEWTFSAYVTKFEPSAPYDGKMTASVSLKPSGVPVLV